jgi:N-acetylmuramoyl-L-alanine amidase CwlA
LTKEQVKAIEASTSTGIQQVEARFAELEKMVAEAQAAADKAQQEAEDTREAAEESAKKAEDAAREAVKEADARVKEVEKAAREQVQAPIVVAAPEDTVKETVLDIVTDKSGRITGLKATTAKKRKTKGESK